MPFKLTKEQFIVFSCVVRIAAVVTVIIVTTIMISFIIRGGTSKEFDCVEAHNKYRNMHGCPPLEVDNDIVEVAKDWAKEIAKIKHMEQSNNSEYGENLWMMDAQTEGEKVTAQEVVKMWYDEVKYYDFADPKYSEKSGHFTQVVWRATKRLGCGEARNGTLIYVVCNYDPPGNEDEYFKDNVPPAI